jgi:hypothetical protein
MRFNNGILIRGISSMALAAGILFLSACGSSSGSNPILGVAIRLAPSVRAVAPGGTVTIAATVTAGSLNWTSTPAGFGTLSNPSATGVTFSAPSSVTAPTIVTITATSTTSSGVSAPVQIAVQTSPAIALQIGGKIVGPQTIRAGQQASVNANLTGDTTNAGVTWTLSPASGAGTLSNVTLTSVSYTAPGSVSVNTPVTLTATSNATAGSTSALEFTVFANGATPAAGGNVAALTTGGGPVLSDGTTPFNSFYTSVTVCVPGTTTCQTIDNILVDTGSEGLRLLQSQLTSIVLPQLGDGAGDYYNNCVQFLDTSYLWGPESVADIYIGGESVGSAPIQLISSGNPTVPTACSNGGSVNENTPTLLGANGILGIGPEPTDCVLQGLDQCDGSLSSILPNYYLCPSSGCATTGSPTTVSAASGQELLNPVVGFSANNNGTSITFPAFPNGTVSAAAANGALVFGIPANITVNTILNLTSTRNPGFFSTTFNGQTLANSFIDTGSSALFFPSTLATCTVNTNFYCPTGTTGQGLTATNLDPSGANPPNTVTFDVGNADTLFSTSDTAFGTLGVPGAPGSFDYGASFFYGRTVYTGIDTSSQAPFYAY